MLVREVQPENAELPILVTLLGMAILVRLVQPENAELPILVTLLEIVVTLLEIVVVLLGVVMLLEKVMLVTEVFDQPKIGAEPSPTFFTADPPNSLGIVTAPVAVEAVIVTPPFSIM